MRDWQESLVNLIREKNTVILATHVNPDGDALGSLLGLADMLESMGKTVIRYLEEPVSHLYRFLPDSDRVVTDLDQVCGIARNAGEDVLGISLDCGDLKRLGKSGSRLLQIHPFVVIDHHQGNDGFGDLAWIEPHRSSTGEMIFDLITALGLRLSLRAASCLYVAIVTDTGSFKYEATSSHTFQVAASLLEAGVRPEEISRNLHDNFSLGRLHLMQQVLATLETFADDAIAAIRVTREMLRSCGCTLEDTENFINLPRSVDSVRVACFLKESGEDLVTVSLRAKGDCNVARVANRFGGGGHRNAAGFRMHRHTLDEVQEILLPVLREELAA